MLPDGRLPDESSFLLYMAKYFFAFFNAFLALSSKALPFIFFGALLTYVKDDIENDSEVKDLPHLSVNVPAKCNEIALGLTA
jgi:hypothetical protein